MLRLISTLAIDVHTLVNGSTYRNAFCTVRWGAFFLR